MPDLADGEEAQETQDPIPYRLRNPKLGFNWYPWAAAKTLKLNGVRFSADAEEEPVFVSENRSFPHMGHGYFYVRKDSVQFRASAEDKRIALEPGQVFIKIDGKQVVQNTERIIVGKLDPANVTGYVATTKLIEYSGRIIQTLYEFLSRPDVAHYRDYSSTTEHRINCKRCHAVMEAMKDVPTISVHVKSL